MTNRTWLVVGVTGVFVVFFGFLMLSVWDTYQPIPGGPKYQQFPDLIVESVQYDVADLECKGVHWGTFNVTVTIRNTGAKTADLPFGKYWLLIWSLIGGTEPPFKELVPGPPTQVAPGQTATLTKKVAAMAQVTPDKSKSGVNFGVRVDPEKLIPESNEDNNDHFEEMALGFEMCPPP
jgi:hypothetical protein